MILRALCGGYRDASQLACQKNKPAEAGLFDDAFYSIGLMPERQPDYSRKSALRFTRRLAVVLSAETCHFDQSAKTIIAPELWISLTLFDI